MGLDSEIACFESMANGDVSFTIQLVTLEHGCTSLVAISMHTIIDLENAEIHE